MPKLLNVIAYVGCALLFDWTVWLDDLSWITFVPSASAVPALVSVCLPLGWPQPTATRLPRDCEDFRLGCRLLHVSAISLTWSRKRAEVWR
jgi:hypothetical protein